MPKLGNRPPSYRFHMASGQAVVTIDGRDHYLGRHGSAPSHERYSQLIAEWSEKNQVSIERTEQLIAELSATEINDLAMIAVASRQLRTLAETPVAG